MLALCVITNTCTHTHTHNSHKKNYNSHFVNFNYGSVSKSVNFLVPILFSYIMTSCQKTKKTKFQQLSKRGHAANRTE